MSYMKFIVRCEVPTRWVPHFLAILKKMQQLGSIGSSRHVTIYADGDGDFRPRFEWDKDLPEPAKPYKEHGGDTLFDAG